MNHKNLAIVVTYAVSERVYIRIFFHATHRYNVGRWCNDLRPKRMMNKKNFIIIPGRCKQQQLQYTHTNRQQTMIYSDMNYHVFIKWQNTSVELISIFVPVPVPFAFTFADMFRVSSRLNHLQIWWRDINTFIHTYKVHAFN